MDTPDSYQVENRVYKIHVSNSDGAASHKVGINYGISKSVMWRYYQCCFISGGYAKYLYY